MIIRRVTALERELVREFYLGLSQEDRSKRFFSAVSDAVVNRYVDQMRLDETTVVAAHDGTTEPIAMAELAPVADAGELAFAVRAEMRQQGVATLLMSRLVDRARMCGLRAVYVMFLSENTPMRRLATRGGMYITRDGTECRGWRPLKPPTGAELARWCIDDAVSHGEHLATLIIAQCGAVMNNGMKASTLPLELILTNAASWSAAHNDGHSGRPLVQ